jgi:hypothetical protein
MYAPCADAWEIHARLRGKVPDAMLARYVAQRGMFALRGYPRRRSMCCAVAMESI